MLPRACYSSGLYLLGDSGVEGVPFLLWASDIFPQVEWDVMALSSPTLPVLTLENLKVPCWGEGFLLRVVTRGCDGFGCSEVGCLHVKWGCLGLCLYLSWTWRKKGLGTDSSTGVWTGCGQD